MQSILEPDPTHRYEQSPLRPFVAFRVSFRRTAWSITSKTKSRTFPSLGAARAFVRKLRGKARPELSAIAFITIEERHGMRSRWTEVRP